MESSTPLRSLSSRPFELLVEMQRRAMASESGRADAPSEWVGVGLRVGDASYVVPRDEIREVMKRPSLTRVPGAAPWLPGLANVRGQLVPVVDIKVLCGLNPTQTDRRTRVVLVNSDDVPMGVLVDEVFGFRRFTAADRHDARPADGDGRGDALREFLDGDFRREGEVWPVLSFLKVIDSDRLLSAT